MKELFFKKQDFQQEAVEAICDVFNGESGGIFQHQVGTEQVDNSQKMLKDKDLRVLGWKNEKLILSDDDLRNNIQNIQKRKTSGIEVNEITEEVNKEDLNLTIEMETGTGKTYAYINTIFELNKKYQWTKFIIVVPSIAIREGIYNSFKDMEKHFEMDYGKRINYFIFDSKKDKEGNQSRNFATDDDINVMIVNIQAINRFQKDKEDAEMGKFSKTTNNIYKKSESGVAAIEYLRNTNPIVIIDEPQSVEGKSKSNKGKQVIRNQLNSLFTIRYSATHLEKYDMVYRLDAIDAFNRKLVKRIEINGIEIEGSTLTHGYFNVKELIISKKDPQVRIEIQTPDSKKVIRKMSVGDNIYVKYSKLEQYKNWVIDDIDPFNRRIIIRSDDGEQVFYEGMQSGEPEVLFKRRIQIRETIKSHLDKEMMNYKLGIKTLSLFFIDSVKKYKDYIEGKAVDTEYAEIFVEEYSDLINKFSEIHPEMADYWKNIEVNRTHQGYFSIDKKSGQLKDPTLSGKGNEKICNDVDPFDEIMRNKKGLLDLKNHTRFIFSHSALKEGWDNPNVFQICILRDNESGEIKRRQELGRGLRLCVNINGGRMDSETQNFDHSKVNILTVIANESYESYAKALQDDYAKSLKTRPFKMTIEVLKTQKLNGKEIDSNLAAEIYRVFRNNNYITIEGDFTDVLKQDLKDKEFKLDESIIEHKEELIQITNKLLNNSIKTGDGKKNKIDYAKLQNQKINDPDFKKLWSYINTKSYYTVDFETPELIKNAIKRIDEGLYVSDIYIKSVKKILKEKLENNELEYLNSKNMKGSELPETVVESYISDNIKIDILAKIVDNTRLTKKTIIKILQGINRVKFKLFLKNPEEFIKNISRVINDEKARIIVKDNLKNVEYFKTDQKLVLSETFEKTIPVNKEKRIYTPERHIYDMLEWDSESVEKKIAEWADNYPGLKVFAKIPKNRYNIQTPTDNFSPDWMMVFKKGTVTHTYCVFESKFDSIDLDSSRREKENWKIACAKKHFNAISDNQFIFKVVSSPEDIKREIKIE